MAQRKVTRKGQKLFYPWDEMEVGDYFDAPRTMVDPHAVCSAAQQREARVAGEEYATSVLWNKRQRPITRCTRIR